MNQQENAGACENRFAARLTRMIAAGALVASMAPVVAYADGNSSAAEADSTSIEATPPLEGFAGAGDSVVAVAAAAADGVSAMAAGIADAGVGVAGDASADEAGSADASATEDGGVDASTVAAKAAGSARAVAATAVVDGDDAGISATATEGTVAMIGANEYDSLDAAVKDAADGASITVLQDCELTAAFNKSITFTGNGKITCNTQMKNPAGDNGWWGYSANNTMTFSGGVEFEWISPGSSTWLMLCLSGNLVVDDGAKVTFRFNSADSGTRNAIYMNANSSISVKNGSTLQFLGAGTDAKAGQAIQLDSTGKSSISVVGGSTFLVDGTNRGYVNSPNIYVENSEFIVQNCTANGSNGGNFTAIDSTVSFLNNAGHGLSATVLSLENSDVTCSGNAYYGITVGSRVDADADTVIVANENGWGYTGGALRLAKSSTVGVFESGCSVTLQDNKRNALENYGKCTFEDGSKLVITGNAEPSNGAGVYNGASGVLIIPKESMIARNVAGASGGGGICNKGIATIADSVQLYNNHASKSGDDIYSTKVITFGGVGSGWSLDGAPDCNGEIHAIDGWYDDSEEVENADSNNASEGGTVSEGGDSSEGGNSQEGTASERGRWQAHEGAEGNHVILTDMADAVDGAITLESSEDAPVALKAAHGVYAVAYEFVSGTEGMELPEDVTFLLPTDGEQHEVGAVVTAQQPVQAIVKVEGGTWTFEGYDANEKTVDGDLTFVGTWVYAADPVVPEDPDTPDEPVTPVAPDVPADPSTPADPDVPAAPDAPSAPQGQDAVVIRPQENSVVLAKTGDDTTGVAASAAVAAAAASASLLALGSRARRRS